MAQRVEVIMTGVGGRGIIVAGWLLARAGMSRYEHAACATSYGVAMWGGSCECTVILSDDEIPSPILSQADSVIVIDASQAKPFEDRVKPGGVMIVESARLEAVAQAYGLKLEREDISIKQIPGIETAHRLGNIQIANLILLGAYLGLTQVVPLEPVEQALEERMGQKEAILALNKDALREGTRLVTTKG